MRERVCGVCVYVCVIHFVNSLKHCNVVYGCVFSDGLEQHKIHACRKKP